MAKKTVGALDGATLRRFRESVGVSGAELAKRIGKNRSWANKIESGLAGLGEREARAVCAAYDESPEFFGLKAGVGVTVFNAALVERRLEELKMSWRRFSELVGVSGQTVYRWKNDGATPAVETVELIAETLSVSSSSLWTHEEAAPPIASGERNVIVAFTESEWRKVSRVVKDLIGRTPKVTRGS